MKTWAVAYCTKCREQATVAVFRNVRRPTHVLADTRGPVLVALEVLLARSVQLHSAAEVQR